MSTIDTSFEQASKYIQRADFKVSNSDKLSLYAYYKQATVGDCNIKRPGMLEQVARAKWDAWNKLKGTDEQSAKLDYIKLAERLTGKVFYKTAVPSADPRIFYKSPTPLFEL